MSVSVVVVGASLAGLRACETLRAEGFRGPITLIGAERHAPYDRPPLSKKVLAGAWDIERVALRRPDDLARLELHTMFGQRAVALDTSAREVAINDGAMVPFDGLIIATGAVCRRLPGQDALNGVFELRTLDDALALRSRLADGARVVVVGAGFIGLEVAATARQAGCDVTVIEALHAPMVRGLGAEMGGAVAQVHMRNGVDIRCGVRLEAIVSSNGTVSGVRLDGGDFLSADVVVVGIGVAPATEWLAGSGVELRNGVVCDATLRALPGIYAAGDLARWPHPLYDEEMRAEHWTNAAEQGVLAARNLLATMAGGEGEPYAEVPFFWSDQFSSRIQFLGRSGAEHGDTEVAVVAGDPQEGPFLALYGRADRLWGVLGVSMPRAVMRFRKPLADRISWRDALDLDT